MKRIIILLLTLMIYRGAVFGQLSKNSCWCEYDRVVTLTVGVPYNVGGEVGYRWDQLGGFVGLKMYQTVKQVTKGYPPIMGVSATLYLKGTYKIAQTGNLRAYFEAWGGIESYGTAIKFSYVLNPDISIFIEPTLSHEQSQAVNGGVAWRF